MTDPAKYTALPSSEIELQERLKDSPPPDWLVRMQEHYARTGTYRPSDLRRLLGDPTRRVEAGPNPSVAQFLREG